MDKAAKGTYLEMLRVVKFVIDTKIFVSESSLNSKGKIGVYECFVTVTRPLILKQESA
jgi:hypothetical protein